MGMNPRSTTAGLQAQIAKGWRPNSYLTNMSMAYFANPGDFVAPCVFPICPVGQSSSYYYKFSKADLARDNVQRKPAYGKVQPAMSSTAPWMLPGGSTRVIRLPPGSAASSPPLPPTRA